MSASVAERVDVTSVDLEPTEPSKLAHIVASRKGFLGREVESAQSIITRSRVTGWPITALCGYVWAPTKDATKFPPCPKCVEVAKGTKSRQKGPIGYA